MYTIQWEMGRFCRNVVKKAYRMLQYNVCSNITYSIKRFDIRGTHNAENLVLLWRTCDELRVGKKYRLILSSEGALYAENHELFEVRFVLPAS